MGGVTAVNAALIPTLAGSVLFTTCVEVFLRHRPTGRGACACGKPRCRSRAHAVSVIMAAGVDPDALTVDDATPQPWHERPVGTAAADPDRATAGPAAAAVRVPVPQTGGRQASAWVGTAHIGRWPVVKDEAAGHLAAQPRNGGFR